MKTLVLLLQYLLLLWPSLLPGVLSIDRVVHAPNHTNVEVGCVPREREALLQFKRRLVDPTEQLLSWSEGDCCRWKGVGCDNQTSHVVMLDLHNNATSLLYNLDYTSALSGEIDPSLLHLRHLQHLDLSGNNLSSSSIPTFIGSFKEMRYLNLSGTNLLGTIPLQLGNISNLQSLDLSYNLELVLDDGGLLGQLSSLQYLDMTGVNLGSSNNWLQALNMLPSILVIRLQQCKIESIPHSLPHVNFTSLTTLVLSQNYMFNSSLPEWLFQVSNLEHLHLGNTVSDSFVSNSMHIIPPTIGNLHKLRFLDLSGNSFAGSIPESFGSLLFLQELYLSENNLTGFIPKSLGNLSRLQKIDFSNNELTGSLPPCLGNLSLLQRLRVSNNNLSGPIPSSFGRLSSLQQLTLTSNKLNGPIPASLGWLESLQELDLSRNELSGSIPGSFCGFLSIRRLDVSWNDKINGTIPECIWQHAHVELLGIGGRGLRGILLESHFSNLTQLKTLYITASESLVLNISSDWIPPFNLSMLYLLSCKVGPQFPMWLQTQNALIALSMTNVGLSGSLPSWIWNFSSMLTVIDLSSNNMSGKLPAATFAPSISDISLGYNKFEGFEWLSNIWEMTPNIMFLSLTVNNFSGTIPSSLCKLDLEGIDLSTNHFTGEVPECLMNVKNYLNLASNNLHGSFPTLVGSHQCSLKSLHLDDNNVSGNLPISLRSCSQMTILDLGKNNFTGNIPTWLVESMLSLKILRLRSNKFFGNIPPSLSNLTSLQILDLSNNILVGRIPSTFGNFVAMMSKHMIYESMGDYYEETVSVVTKGKYMSYTRLLPLVTSLDISSNELTGEIPQELGRLIGLVNLNLSGNHLTRNISETISSLQSLETLDLSRNDLSGGIPQSMSKMTYLNHLNLSFNNLSGKIPTDNQFQTFTDPSIFMGNPGLCGSPLKDCDSAESSITKSTSRQHKDDHEMLWLYISTVLGFIVGFWTFYGTLIFKKAWRYSYFQLVDDMNKLFYIRCNRLVKKMFK